MNMAANIVEYTVNPEQAETLHDRVRTHLVPATRTATGYRGFLLLDRGAGSRLAILLFDSAANAESAQKTLAPLGVEHTASLMQGPIQRSLGTVVINDGEFAEASTT